MNYFLCMNPLPLVTAEELATFLDKLEYPWEWAPMQAIHEGPSQLIVVRCESWEDLSDKLNKVPDRRIMTAFGFAQPIEQVVEV